MVKKIITWVDLQGRYRVTSPAYDDPTRPAGETEDETITRVLVNIKEHYGLPGSHVFHFVEDTDQRQRLGDIAGTYFRYAGKPDSQGRRGAEDGAWEIDTDGRPKVDMPKARLVQMDYIRVVRDAELVKLDVESLLAIESKDTAEQTRITTEKQVLRDLPGTFDLSIFLTPDTLKDAWPPELPTR